MTSVDHTQGQGVRKAVIQKPGYDLHAGTVEQLFDICGDEFSTDFGPDGFTGRKPNIQVDRTHLHRLRHARIQVHLNLALRGIVDCAVLVTFGIKLPPRSWLITLSMLQLKSAVRPWLSL